MYKLRSMGTRTPPTSAPRLWHWMHERRVTLDELAIEIQTVAGKPVNPVYLGQLRRGEGRPSDSMKEKIAEATRRLEERQGVAEPVGVPVTAWFSPGAS